jgi:hypothetical protein
MVGPRREIVLRSVSAGGGFPFLIDWLGARNTRNFSAPGKDPGNAQTDARHSPAAGIKPGRRQKTDNAMTFERDMDLFFVRNCYSEQERELVKAGLDYRLAAEKKDAVQAQEVATRILEARPPKH